MPKNWNLRRALPLLLAAISLTACGPLTGPAATTAPEAGLVVRAAYPSELDLDDLPSLMALDRLAEQGYEVKTTFFAQPELAVSALAQGQADIGMGGSRPYWAAITAGSDSLSIMEKSANPWLIVATTDVKTCADLAGRPMGQHSEGGESKAMTDAYIQENCAGVIPEVLIIPGSENRAAALLAGEIDATPLELVDAIQVERNAPGRFHVLANFATGLPQLKTGLVQVNRDFAQAHPQAVRDFVRALLAMNREIAADPQALLAEAEERLEFDPEVLREVVDRYRQIGIWDVNGGLTEADVAFSLAFYAKVSGLDPALTAADVADLSYLNDVLAEIGRQE